MGSSDAVGGAMSRQWHAGRALRLVARAVGAALLAGGVITLVALMTGVADAVLEHWSCASDDGWVHRTCMPGEAKLTAFELTGAAMLLGLVLVLLSTDRRQSRGPVLVLDLRRLRRRSRR